MRIDKWLWCVRIYKTRQIASKACTSGKVKINNKKIKPSRLINQNDIISIQKGYVKYKYEALNLLDSRISAKLVNNFIKNVTPKKELIKLQISKNIKLIDREKGLGRPTKKERRKIDKYKWENLEK
tara:strand:+ start:166 stop:543 length:378 start_codon:yes stop_codon:yes gene_type:complete